MQTLGRVSSIVWIRFNRFNRTLNSIGNLSRMILFVLSSTYVYIYKYTKQSKRYKWESIIYEIKVTWNESLWDRRIPERIDPGFSIGSLTITSRFRSTVDLNIFPLNCTRSRLILVCVYDFTLKVMIVTSHLSNFQMILKLKIHHSRYIDINQRCCCYLSIYLLSDICYVFSADPPFDSKCIFDVFLFRQIREFLTLIIRSK